MKRDKEEFFKSLMSYIKFKFPPSRAVSREDIVILNGFGKY